MDTLDLVKTTSAWTENARCSEHDLEPQIHMMEDFSNEKPKA